VTPVLVPSPAWDSREQGAKSEAGDREANRDERGMRNLRSRSEREKDVRRRVKELRELTEDG
jgi:hypothetical protein